MEVLGKTPNLYYDFARVYPVYITKAERKDRTKAELEVLLNKKTIMKHSLQCKA